VWTLQRLCFGPDVAAADVDRGENRDLGMATTAASKMQLTEEARLENLASRIHPVHLKDTLRQIKPNGANLHDGRLLSCGVTNDDHVRHSMPFSRAVHPINPNPSC
jgi:hypothetical protein